MIKAVIFDMDGVLVESEPYHTKAVIEVLKEVDINVTEEEISEYVGLIYSDKLKKIFARRNITYNILELSERINKRSMKFIKKELRLSPVVRRLLIKLRNNGYRIGLVSSSFREYVDVIVSITKTRKYFDVIIGGDEVKRRKPDPECYILTAKKLNLKPDECLVIEDSIPGVIATKEAGMKCVALPNPYIKDGDFSRADMIINSLEEVDLDTIKKI